MAILTAGYGNLGFANFLGRLKDLGVTHLVDVRRVPGSRYWSDFCRPRLDDLIAPTGIRYVWLGDLIGGIGDRAVPVDSEGKPDYRALWSEEPFQRGLDKVVAASKRPGWQICLMCGCLRPQNCHRGYLIGAALLERAIEVLHVESDGSLVPHEQAMTLPQSSLF